MIIISNMEVFHLMSISKSKQLRRKLARSGRNNPEISRSWWQRKPQTQVVQNKKAEQRRTLCRQKGSRDGADFLGKQPNPAGNVTKKFRMPITPRNCIFSSHIALVG